MMEGLNVIAQRFSFLQKFCEKGTHILGLCFNSTGEWICGTGKRLGRLTS